MRTSPRALVLAVAAVPALLAAFAGCEGDDLPPSRGPGSPSALPSIWNLNGASNVRNQALCDQATKFLTNCGAGLGDASFCNSASNDCLECFQVINCSQINTCFNLCASTQSLASGVAQKK